MPKILLVEDNEMNRDMLSRRLTRKGYEIVIAVDGQQGVDLAHSENPDLILMDMRLPVKDGWTATKELKADDYTKSIPAQGLADDERSAGHRPHRPCHVRRPRASARRGV